MAVHSADYYKKDHEERIWQLMEKLKEKGINLKKWRKVIDPKKRKHGTYHRTMCPFCKGGSNEELCLRVFIPIDGHSAKWNCIRASCRWKGYAQPAKVSKMSQAKNDAESETEQVVESNQAVNKVYQKLCEEDLNLHPLCDGLITYFSKRMISAETLRRNNVMQCNWKDQIVIAFTYRRNGVLVGCKYRGVAKKYSQEANTEKNLYGLDDKQARDVIIVGGEIDKLSMEEAGYRNCVSVPHGAPSKDKKYQYLWNCKAYLDLASRIILAMDADPPGQALAVELAYRLGKKRCWRVIWPRKNETDICKDANEVLMFLGPQALRKVIEEAELYPVRGLFTFQDFFPEIDDYYWNRRRTW